MEELSKKMMVAKRLFFPISILIVAIAGYVFYRSNVFPLISVQLSQSIQKYIATLFTLIAGFTIQRFINATMCWYKENIAVKTASRLDDELIPLLQRTVNIIIWVMALLIILPFYGVSISALVTTLGVGSLAIALAAQDTISNIISGFMIMIDRPFRIGDKIKLSSGEVVVVYDIGIRRSKFIYEDNSIIFVPNLDLCRSKITNYTYGKEELNKRKEI